MDVSLLRRNRKSLRLLSGWCRPTTSKGQRPCRTREMPALDRTAKMLFLAAHGMSLVWVRLSLLSKGKPDLHAVVCVPTTEDLKLLNTRPVSREPQEPPHKDHFKSRIKLGKKDSKKAEASSQSSDKTESKGSERNPTTSEDSRAPSSPSSDLVFGLWPDPLPSVTSHCSRVTLGWVTQGDFSLSAGCGEALGFVAVAGLLNNLLNQPLGQRGTVLLRNPTSLQYRFAKINIEVWTDHLRKRWTWLISQEHCILGSMNKVNSYLFYIRLEFRAVKLHDALFTRSSDKLCLDSWLLTLTPRVLCGIIWPAWGFYELPGDFEKRICGFILKVYTLFLVFSL